jgi:hypothetical protein
LIIFSLSVTIFYWFYCQRIFRVGDLRKLGWIFLSYCVKRGRKAGIINCLMVKIVKLP